MSSKTYSIGNMDCAGCAREVEVGVSRLDGVDAVEVDFATTLMMVDGTVTFESLKERVEALGKTIALPEDEQPETPRTGGIVGFWRYLIGRHETRLALIGGGLILLTLLLSMTSFLPEGVSAVMYSAAMLIAVFPIARSGFNALRLNREFTINLLMTIAAVGAILIGEYLEAATVIFLFAIGEALEGYTADRARDSLRSLMALKPLEALRIQDEQEQMVHINTLAIGDEILVKPGERVPMDGKVIAGTSSVNQAPITGESIPVAKTVDDLVFAGSINEVGLLRVQVTRLAQDNTLSRIIQMVTEAQRNRAQVQRTVDQFAHYYTPAVMVIALLVALAPPLLFGAPFYDTADGHGWFYRALTILVIACPCALVISTPVTVISALTAAARRGVLIKGGAYLEALAQVRVFAFDKTGTLTQGKPVVMQTHATHCDTAGDDCADCEDVLALAAALERRSNHPLAQAVLESAQARQLAGVYAAAEQVEMIPGHGIRGKVESASVVVGSHGWFDDLYPHNAALCQMVNETESKGQTTMMVGADDEVRGFIAVADQARETSAAVVRQLGQMGIQTIMLTGDNETVATAIGKQIGVDDVRAGLLPEDKVQAIEALKDVAMVGDGVNDTPALAAATVGIAMGGAGSAQAMETADIVLMADDLTQLPYALRMARFARKLIRQNIALTFGMKALFLLLAMFGGVTMWMAIFADVGMSLVVTLNGTRPLRLE